ncbi:MAG: hypothetical protein PHO64_06995 [Thiomonas sp.]|nr:hypothetical protein [Thiomonas sp.]
MAPTRLRACWLCSAASLFSSGSLIWGQTGQLAQPLFKPGLTAEAGAAEAGFDAATANYHEMVLQSLRQMANVLRALDHDAQAQQTRIGLRRCRPHA